LNFAKRQNNKTDRKRIGLINRERKEEKKTGRLSMGLERRGRRKEEEMKKELGFVTVVRSKKKEEKKMRKGLSIIVGIAILLFAYSVSADVVTNGLVSWWTFDETSGTTAGDSEGSNDGTLTNGTAWTTETAGAASSGAVSFDGTDDYVLVAGASGLDYSTGTWDLWVMADNWTDGEYRNMMGGKEGGSYLELQKTKNAGTFHFVLQGVAVLVTTSGGHLTNGAWHHIAATWNFDTDAYELFIDGVSRGSSSTDYDAPTTPTNLSIGAGIRPNPIAYWDGCIDEVRIYDRVLNQSEIQQNIAAIPEPSTLLLLGAGLSGLLAFRRIGRRSGGC